MRFTALLLVMLSALIGFLADSVRLQAEFGRANYQRAEEFFSLNLKVDKIGRIINMISV